MALFESYERRIDKINGVLAQYGIGSVEECRKALHKKVFIDHLNNYRHYRH